MNDNQNLPSGRHDQPTPPRRGSVAIGVGILLFAIGVGLLLFATVPVLAWTLIPGGIVWLVIGHAQRSSTPRASSVSRPTGARRRQRGDDGGVLLVTGASSTDSRPSTRGHDEPVEGHGSGGREGGWNDGGRGDGGSGDGGRGDGGWGDGGGGGDGCGGGGGD